MKWVFCSKEKYDNCPVNLEQLSAIEKFDESFEGAKTYLIGFHKPMGYIEWDFKGDKQQRDYEYEKVLEFLK